MWPRKSLTPDPWCEMTGVGVTPDDPHGAELAEPGFPPAPLDTPALAPLPPRALRPHTSPHAPRGPPFSTTANPGPQQHLFIFCFLPFIESSSPFFLHKDFFIHK